MRPGLTSRDLLCGMEALPDELCLALVRLCVIRPDWRRYRGSAR